MSERDELARVVRDWARPRAKVDVEPSVLEVDLADVIISSRWLQGVLADAWDKGATMASHYNFDFADLHDDVLRQNPYFRSA